MTNSMHIEKGLDQGTESAGFVEKYHRGGSNTSPNSSLTVDLVGAPKSDWVAVKVKLPRKLYEEIMEIITYLGLWKNLSEFIRFALLVAGNQWVEEMRRAKNQSEKGK